MVYLICFNDSHHQAHHYIGFAESSIEGRLDIRSMGRSAKLLRALNKANVGYQLARVWKDGDRSFERMLKKQKNIAQHCPVCSKGNTNVQQPLIAG